MVDIQDDGFSFKNITPSDTIFKVLCDIDYDVSKFENYFYSNIENQNSMNKTEKHNAKKHISNFLKQIVILG